MAKDSHNGAGVSSLRTWRDNHLLFIHAATATSGSASPQEAQAAAGVVPHAAYPQLHLAMLVAAAAAAAVPWQRRRELATLTTAAEGADEQ